MTNTVENMGRALRLHPHFTFQTFCIGKSNYRAFELAKSIATVKNKSVEVTVFYGKRGLGKTHLLQAIAWEFLENHPKKKVIFVSADDFVWEWKKMKEGCSEQFEAFINTYMDTDLLLFDNVEMLLETEDIWSTFEGIFKHLCILNKQIVLTSDKEREELKKLYVLARESSSEVISEEFQEPDYELCKDILKVQIENLDKVSYVFSEEIQDFLISKNEGSILILLGYFWKIIVVGKLEGREKIDLDYVKECLNPSYQVK